MTPPAVDISDLSVCAGGRQILHLERLRVEPGEVLTVLGPNGAGKTTLLKCCLGFVRPRRGRVCVLGEAVHRLNGSARVRLRRRIGYVPQVLAAHSEMPLTAREVVAIGRTGLAGLLRPLRRADWRIVEASLRRLGLSALADRAYRDLSGGEQRKILIAKAMVQQPELLVLDEPTANLDLFWREQIVRTLEDLFARARLTVLLVCHELEVIPPCSERVLLLEAGRDTACGPPHDVLTPDRLARLYGPRLELVHRGGRHALVPAAGRAGA